MRSLQLRDVFPAIRLINSLKIKEEIQAMFEKFDEAKDEVIENVGEDAEKDVKAIKSKLQDAIGYGFVFSLFEHAASTNAEKAVYEFLASPMECTVEEIAEIDLLVLADTIEKDFDYDGWASFLHSLLAMMKRKKQPKSKNLSTDDTTE